MKTIVLILAALAAFSLPADARERAKGQNVISCDQRGCSDRQAARNGPPSDDMSGRAHRRRARSASAPEAAGVGIVRSGKTGATARVSGRYAGKFQAYIDALEARGAVIRFMGGIRPGHCSNRSLHPCGMALDVCQTARGVVDRRCRMPGRKAAVALAASLGLVEGGRWCHSDYGHVQAKETGGCGSNLYAALARHKRAAGMVE